ncbi:hypothetical protein HDU98_007969 [Podochytrium sp. JEL0797]|nr:hypothetical protein HDU98_007969 [Podochytrium sp. JEL0797]
MSCCATVSTQTQTLLGFTWVNVTSVADSSAHNLFVTFSSSIALQTLPVPANCNSTFGATSLFVCPGTSASFPVALASTVAGLNPLAVALDGVACVVSSECAPANPSTTSLAPPLTNSLTTMPVTSLVAMASPSPSPSQAPTTPLPSTSSPAVSPGAVAGIVVALLALIAALCFFVLRRRKQKGLALPWIAPHSNTDPDPVESAPPSEFLIAAHHKSFSLDRPLVSTYATANEMSQSYPATDPFASESGYDDQIFTTTSLPASAVVAMNATEIKPDTMPPTFPSPAYHADVSPITPSRNTDLAFEITSPVIATTPPQQSFDDYPNESDNMVDFYHATLVRARLSLERRIAEANSEALVEPLPVPRPPSSNSQPPPPPHEVDEEVIDLRHSSLGRSRYSLERRATASSASTTASPTQEPAFMQPIASATNSPIPNGSVSEIIQRINSLNSPTGTSPPEDAPRTGRRVVPPAPTATASTQPASPTIPFPITTTTSTAATPLLPIKPQHLRASDSLTSPTTRSKPVKPLLDFSTTATPPVYPTTTDSWSYTPPSPITSTPVPKPLKHSLIERISGSLPRPSQMESGGGATTTAQLDIHDRSGDVPVSTRNSVGAGEARTVPQTSNEAIEFALMQLRMKVVAERGGEETEDESESEDSDES